MPMGSPFMVLNASLLLVCILRAFAPGCIRVFVSELSACMTMHTSPKSPCAATVAASMRFIAASLDPLSLLLWAPVMTTGTGVLSMNERAAEV